MNTISILPHVTREERSQFAQLTGYSVSGWGDLSYASRKDVAKADEIVEALIEHKEPKS